MIKAILIFITTFNIFAIDSYSFKNTDRYTMLKIDPIKNSKNFEVYATFYPPTGKKLNHASYVKVYEKLKNSWEEVDEIIPNESLGVESEYVLKKAMQSSRADTELAIEVEFIHCTAKGGQCAMERYLGKIPRASSTKKKDVKLTLRID